MMFVIDKPQMQRMIAIVRDDRTPATQGAAGPYMRIEASGGSITLTGREAEATFPATVYEEGVLFLRVTLFRRLLGTIRGRQPVRLHQGPLDRQSGKNEAAGQACG